MLQIGLLFKIKNQLKSTGVSKQFKSDIFLTQSKTEPEQSIERIVVNFVKC